jgi:hypothetical protein
VDEQEECGRDGQQRHQFARPASTVRVLLSVCCRSRVRISARGCLLTVYCVGLIIQLINSPSWPTWSVNR